jgi:hypothetical protein
VKATTSRVPMPSTWWAQLCFIYIYIYIFARLDTDSYGDEIACEVSQSEKNRKMIITYIFVDLGPLGMMELGP